MWRSTVPILPLQLVLHGLTKDNCSSLFGFFASDEEKKSLMTLAPWFRRRRRTRRCRCPSAWRESSNGDVHRRWRPTERPRRRRPAVTRSPAAKVLVPGQEELECKCEGGWKPTSLSSIFSVWTSVSIVPSGSKKWMFVGKIRMLGRLISFHPKWG